MSKAFKTPLSQKMNRDVFFGTSKDLPRIIELNLNEIVTNAEQPRKHFDTESLNELADSIKRHGIINPITVVEQSKNAYVIVAGERRFRATQLAGIESIPAIITSGDPDEIALIENIQRQDLTALEEAEGLERLQKKHQYTHEELAHVIRKSRTSVTELMRLVTLHEQIKNECRTSDNVRKSVLIELSRIKEPSEQLAAWEAIKNQKATVKQARSIKKSEEAQKVEEERPKPISKEAKILRDGHLFISKIRKAFPKISHDEAMISDLKQLKQELEDIINRFAETPKS